MKKLVLLVCIFGFMSCTNSKVMQRLAVIDMQVYMIEMKVKFLVEKIDRYNEDVMDKLGSLTTTLNILVHRMTNMLRDIEQQIERVK